MSPCPGTCNAWWRALTAEQQAASETQPRPGEPAWCAPCTARIRRALAELDYLGALLAAVADGHHEQPLDPRHAGAYAASPSPAADDLEELESLLCESEDTYRALRGLPSAPRHGYLASVTSETIAWLTAHLDGVLTSPVAEPFGAEILQLHRTLAAKVKAGTGRHRKPVPCPRCGLRLLTWAEGDDYVACAGCNRHMTMGEYEAEVAAAQAAS